MKIGDTFLNFELLDTVTEKSWVASEIIQSRPCLVVIMCNHCPFVKKVEQSISNLGKIYNEQLCILAISPSDPSFYPDDSPQNLREQANRLGFNFPYFYDDRQEVSKSLGVKFMPDFYLFDTQGKLVYHGQIDDARPSNNIESDAKDLRVAIDAVLYSKEMQEDQKSSEGCEISWK